LYQEFAITPGTSYTVQCDAKATGYASIALSVMNSGYNSLGSEDLVIDSSYSIGIMSCDAHAGVHCARVAPQPHHFATPWAQAAVSLWQAL